MGGHSKVIEKFGIATNMQRGLKEHLINFRMRGKNECFHTPNNHKYVKWIAHKNTFINPIKITPTSTVTHPTVYHAYVWNTKNNL